MNSISPLQLKALLLSVITEVKCGVPLHKQGLLFKKTFKKAVGLKPQATNLQVCAAIANIYAENHMLDEYNSTIVRMKAADKIPLYELPVLKPTL